MTGCVFCALPEKDRARDLQNQEIILNEGTVYVVAPLGYKPEECLLIIPRGHYGSFAEATLADVAIAVDAALAEEQLVRDFFNGGDYQPAENCGKVGGNSGRRQGHAHRWLVNCSDGSKNAAGMGLARLRDVVNFLPRQSVTAALAACAERRG